jgi:1-acyl-sn-glycerol-3-phosphate acyltransferase
MTEARIIPIKAEPATEPDAKPAGEAPPQRRPASRRATADSKPAAKSPNGVANRSKAQSGTATGEKPKRRSATPKARAGATRRTPEPKAAPPTAERDQAAEPVVTPPEDMQDLGTFVSGKQPEPRDEPAAEPEPADAKVWPNRDGVRSERPEAADPEPPATDEWERKVAGALAFVRRRLTGEYEVDEFGFDAELTTTVLAAPLRPVYEKWFRVEVSGLENVPDTGAGLIVANHSGVIALDGAVTALALLDHHPAHRHLRMLGADLVFKTPILGEFARKAGHTLACNADAERLLSSGELVGVYPEGFKGVGKPFSERYKLQRFGRGGFVAAALRTRAPIIPCSIVGAEEIYPMLGNAKLLARIFGLPYFPLTPTFPWLGPLGMIPLPSKWYIEFGEPIETESLADRADDPMLVFNVADQVRETIQQTLYRLLMKRKSVFS